MEGDSSDLLLLMPLNFESLESLAYGWAAKTFRDVLSVRSGLVILLVDMVRAYHCSSR
jgi:hypothetical protein